VGSTEWDWAIEARYEEEVAARCEGVERLNHLYQAAEFWSDADEHQRALDLLNLIAEQSPDPAECAADPLLAYCLFRVGQEEDGRAVARGIAEQAAAGRDWEAYEELAGYLVRAGRLEDALADYDAALLLVLALEQPDTPLADRPAIRPFRLVARGRLTVRTRLGLPPDEHDRAVLRSMSRTERWRHHRGRRRGGAVRVIRG
jgi:tetratricopeptide (TPR) repeat protein